MLDIATLGLRIDARQVRDASRELQGLERSGAGAETAAGRMEAAFARLKTMAAAVAGALAAIQLSKFIQEVTLLASRYNELGIVMSRLGKNAGISSGQLAETEEALRKTGISALKSRESIAKLISANIDLSQATKLARLAQDAAVIAGVNSSEAFARLIKGIQSAEKETLETLGLNVNFQQSYEKLAKSLGKSADELTTLEKTQAAVNAVMEKAPGIAGAYEDSLTNAGKQLRSMDRYIEDLKVQLGQPFQNPFGDLIGAGNTALKFLTENVDTIRTVIQRTIDAFGPAIKIAAAYFALFVAGPALYAAVAAALTKLVGVLAVYAMNVAIGQANTIGLNTALFGTSVSAQLAAGSLTKAALAANVLFAAFAGWQIGTYLEEQFVEVRVFAETLTGAILEMWEDLKLAARLALDAMTVMWRATFSGLTATLAPFYDAIASGLTKMGFEEKGTQIQEFADRVRAAGESQGTFASRTAEARAEHERNVNAIRSVTQSHVDAIMVADKVSEATRGTGFAARKAAEEVAGLSKEQKQAVKAAFDFIEGQRQELEAIGKNEDQLRMLAAARAAAAAPLENQRKAIMAYALAITIQSQTEARAKEEKDRYTRAVEAQLDARLQDSLAAQQAVDQMQREVDTYGMGAAAVTRYTIAKLEERKATLMLAGASEGEIEALDRLIAKNGELMELQNQKDDLDQLFDTKRAESFGDALRNAFGEAGNALAQLTNALQDYVEKQELADQERAKAKLKYAGDDKRIARELEKINDQEAKDRVAGYAAMTGAAKGFFKQHTGGYKLMEAAEKGFRLYELAMNAQVMAAKLGAATVTTTAAVAGNQAAAASATSAAATQIAANQAVGASAAVAGVANQAKGDPYSAFARMAAMAAIMAALGFAVGGIGGGSKTNTESAEEVQKRQGAGGVFGDAAAKSESIARSLEFLEDNSDMMLPLTQDMLSSLRGIEAAMGGLANLVVRTAGITDGGNMGIATGTNPIGGLAVTSSKFFGGFGPMGKIMGSLASAIVGKVTKDITDSGIQFGGRVGDLQNGQGYSQYANVTTTKSRLFGLVKSSNNSTQTAALNGELAEQFGLVFKNLETVLRSSATALGRDADSIGAAVQNVVIDMTKLSLKDLKGEELQAAINAVLSKATDDVAQAALPGFDAFRKLGEGYAETVIRVATGIEQAGFELDRLGVTAIAYTEVLNKQGDAGAEIVRQSILAREGMSGVGAIMKTLSGSASELAGTYRELLDVQSQMRLVGMDPAALGVGLIRGAGGLSELSSGLSDYFDKFFTDAEKVAAQTAAMGSKFAALGLSMPSTVEGFRALVEANPALAGQLFVLSGSFADLMEATAALAEQSDNAAEVLRQKRDLEIELMRLTGRSAEALAAERALELAAMDASLRPLQERVWAIKDEEAARWKAADDAMAALRRAVNAEKDLKTKAFNELMKGYDKAIEASRAKIASLSSLAQTLEGAQDSVGLGTVNRREAQASLQAMLAIARAGGVGTLDQKKLQKTLDALGRDSAEMFGSAREYEVDRLQTAIAVGELGDLTDDALSVEEKALENLEKMREAAKLAHEAEMARLDALVTGAQLQLDALRGLDVSVKSVPAALAGFSNAVQAIVKAGVGGSGTSPVTGPSAPSFNQAAISDLYEKVLGRGADAGGLAFYAEQLSRGNTTLAAIEAAMKTSEEYAKLIAGSASRSGGDIVASQSGTRAYVATTSSGKGDNEDVVKAVDTMRAELKQVMTAVAGYTQRTAQTNEDMERRERQNA